MAYCGKCGNQLKEGAKFCPKCGTQSNRGTKRCSECGTQLNDGVKFCPKCGSPNRTDYTKEKQTPIVSDRGTNLYENDNIIGEENIQEEGVVDNSEGYVKYMILFFIIFGIIWIYKDDIFKSNTENNNSAVKQEVVEQSNTIRETEERRRQEEENKANIAKQQQFQAQVMEHVNAIQQIMRDINYIHNNAIVTSRNDQFKAVNAVGDINDLSLKGDEHFNRIISLARKEGRQDVISQTRIEKETFDRQVETMKRNLLYNNVY